MRGVAVALRYAVDHHVDAAGAFKTANIDRNAGIGSILQGKHASGAAQHVIELRAAETIDLFAVNPANRCRNGSRRLCVVRSANGDRLQRDASFFFRSFLFLRKGL